MDRPREHPGSQNRLRRIDVFRPDDEIALGRGDVQKVAGIPGCGLRTNREWEGQDGRTEEKVPEKVSPCHSDNSENAEGEGQFNPFD
jgi:hypothetical protein